MPEAVAARPAFARRFRTLQAAVCVAAGALLAALLPGVPWARWPELLFFTALAVVAFRLRVRYAENYVGLEAAALVPAILILDSPGAAMLVCVVGDAISKLVARPRRRLTLSNAFDVAQLSLAYGVAALFSHALHSAGSGWARLAALATGVLLVFFFVNTALRLRLPRARPHRAARAAARDRPLPAHGASAARSDRHPRGPRLRGLRPRRDAPRVLPGRAGLLRGAQPLLDGAPGRRGLPAEPRARRHARDLHELRRQHARRPLRARLRRHRASPSRRGHGGPRVAGGRRRGLRRPRVGALRPRPGAKFSPGRDAGRLDERRFDRDSAPEELSIGRRPRDPPRSGRRITRSASGSRPSSSTRAC